MIEFSNLLDNLLLNPSKKKKSKSYQIILILNPIKIKFGLYQF